MHSTHDSTIDYYCLDNTSYHPCTRTMSIGTEGSQAFIACYEDALCPSAIKYITMDTVPTIGPYPLLEYAKPPVQMEGTFTQMLMTHLSYVLSVSLCKL